MSPSEVRFAADAMVQSLSKWLRLLGYDCLAGDEWFGRKLVEQAVQENRWILSRNTKFAQYLPRELLQAMHLFHVESECLPQQLTDIVRHFQLNTETFLFTRCVECNAPLQEVPLEEVSAELPPHVRAHHTDFWKCEQCGRIYWRGSHVERSVDRLRKWLGTTRL